MGHQANLEVAVDQLPSLPVFTTYSVGHHWYDLHRLMPPADHELPPSEDSPRSPRERNRAFIDNINVADW